MIMEGYLFVQKIPFYGDVIGGYMKGLFKCYKWHLLLFINIYFISFFVMEIAQMYDKVNRAGIQFVDALSDTSIQFIVEAEDAFDFSFLKAEDREFALLQRVSHDMPIYRVLSMNRFFRKEDGKFFEKKDFEGKQPAMICGSRAQEIVEVDPFIYNGTEYHKTGEIQEDCGFFAAQYGVFVIEDGVGSFQEAELLLEGNDGNDVQQIFNQIIDWADEHDFTVKVLDRKESRVNDIYNVSESGAKIVLLSILLLCSSIIIIMYFWLGQYDETRRVYFLLGMKNVERKIGMDYTKIFVLAYACTLFSSKNVSWGMKGYVFVILYAVMGAVLTGYLILGKKGVDADGKDREGNRF